MIYVKENWMFDWYICLVIFSMTMPWCLPTLYQSASWGRILFVESSIWDQLPSWLKAICFDSWAIGLTPPPIRSVELC